MRLLPIAFGVALLVGCGKSDSNRTAASDCAFAFPKVGLCAALTWNANPEVRKLTEATLRFYDAKGSLKDGPFAKPEGDVVVPSPEMPTMGHDSGKNPKTTPVQGKASDYKVENVWFNMRGKWVLTVEIRKDGKLVDKATLPLNL